jgi:hypothetical protein
MAMMTDEVTRPVPLQAARHIWRRTVKPSLALLAVGGKIARNAIMRSMVRADYQRWSSPGGLEAWWDERTQRLASMIEPGSTVIEFGAGRRSLERFLPPGCVYTPSDLVDRGPGTIVCDLNHRPLPDLSRVNPQLAVFSGVLEYIRDIPAIVEWLAASGIECCITSYEAMPAEHMGLSRLREKVRRSRCGYMSNMTEAQFILAFERGGFSCLAKQVWTTQGLYRFERRRPR